MKKQNRRTLIATSTCLGLFAWTGAVHAATLTVKNLSDHDPDSLRDRINTAAANDTIIFQAGLAGPIKLAAASGPLSITKTLIIQGPGADKITVSGENSVRVLNITNGIVTISGLKIANGSANGGAGASLSGASVQATFRSCVFNANNSTGSYNGGAISNSSGARLTLENCALSDNNANVTSGTAHGGALNNDATAILTNCTITANHAGGHGGGIYSTRNLTVSRSMVSGNTANGYGGGIYESVSMQLSDSTISGNHATGYGGGVYALGATTVNRCTLAGNNAGSNGGGIYVNSGASRTFILNSTLSGNSAGNGGAVYTEDGATLRNCTLTTNTATTRGGGIYRPNDTTTLMSTIVAGNIALSNADGPDVYGTVTSEGFNLIGKSDGSTGFIQATDKKGSGASPLDPKLGALTNNGGLTQTCALLAGSPAIDAGKAGTDANGNSLTTDQRGQGRPFDNAAIPNAAGGDGSDIGAYEVLPAPTIRINDISKVEGNSGTTAFVFIVSLSTPPSQTVSVNYATANGTTNPATAGDDYNTSNGIITFTPGGGVTRTITVGVNGDTALEPNDTFLVTLSGAVNGSITDSQGVGTVVNDDTARALPRLVITDVASIEGNSGLTHMVFTVNVLEPSGQQVKVNYVAVNGTATITGNDYTDSAGTLTIAPGQTYGLINLAVRGDTTAEAHETFFINLSAAVNATLADAQGQGTIRNDDTAAATSALSARTAKTATPQSASTEFAEPAAKNLDGADNLIRAEASASASAVTLAFSATLDYEAVSDATNYTVRVNGQTVRVEGVELNEAHGTITLLLPLDTLQMGEEVTVEWLLRDLSNQVVSGSRILIAK